MSTVSDYTTVNCLKLSNSQLSLTLILSTVSNSNTVRWKRKQVVVGALEHDYRHGFQYVMPKTEPGEILASHWSIRPGT